MGNRCMICGFPNRLALESAVQGGMSISDACRQMGIVNYEAAKRHFRAHVRQDLRKSRTTGGRSTVLARKVKYVPATEVFERAFGQEPTDYQHEYLASEASLFWLKGCQIGATQAAAAKSVAAATGGSARDIVIVSPSEWQSGHVTGRARVACWELGLELPQDSAGLLRLENGSRIISLPGTSKSIRGYAPYLVIIDEGAYVEEDTFSAARPMVAATGGQMVVQGTPAGPSGWFYELFTSPIPGWVTMRTPSAASPHVSEEFLERERASMDSDSFAREYLAEFSLGAGLRPVTSQRLDELTLQCTCEEGGPPDPACPSHRDGPW